MGGQTNPTMPDSLTSPRRRYASALLGHFGLLAWLALTLYPFSADAFFFPVALILPFWGLRLALDRLSPWRRLAALGLLVGGMAALALPFYSFWRCWAVGCPHCFRAEWAFLALADCAVGPWVLWAIASCSLASTLLLPCPRWSWVDHGDTPGLATVLLLAFVFVLPLLMLAGGIWTALAPAPNYGG